MFLMRDSKTGSGYLKALLQVVEIIGMFFFLVLILSLMHSVRLSLVTFPTTSQAHHGFIEVERTHEIPCFSQSSSASPVLLSFRAPLHRGESGG